MARLWLFPFIIVMCVVIELGAEKRTNFARKYTNKISSALLTNPVLRSYESRSPLDCLVRCQRESGCDGVNVRRGDNNCDVLASGSTSSLVTSATHDYYALEATMSQCPDGWQPWGDSCVVVLDGAVDYSAALAACSQQSGRLVVIDTSAKRDDLTEILDSVARNCTRDWFQLTALPSTKKVDCTEDSSGQSDIDDPWTCFPDVCGGRGTDDPRTTLLWVDYAATRRECQTYSCPPPAATVDSWNGQEYEKYGQTGFWLGATESGGSWVWSDGRELDETPEEQTGYPDTPLGCVVAYDMADYPWFQEACEHLHRPVCEMNP